VHGEKAVVAMVMGEIFGVAMADPVQAKITAITGMDTMEDSTAAMVAVLMAVAATVGIKLIPTRSEVILRG
jgi:hypothetical protein